MNRIRICRSGAQGQAEESPSIQATPLVKRQTRSTKRPIRNSPAGPRSAVPTVASAYKQREEAGHVPPFTVKIQATVTDGANGVHERTATTGGLP